MVMFWFFSSEKDVYVGYLPLAHVLELIAGNVYPLTGTYSMCHGLKYLFWG